MYSPNVGSLLGAHWEQVRTWSHLQAVPLKSCAHWTTAFEDQPSRSSQKVSPSNPHGHGFPAFGGGGPQAHNRAAIRSAARLMTPSLDPREELAKRSPLASTGRAPHPSAQRNVGPAAPAAPELLALRSGQGLRELVGAHLAPKLDQLLLAALHAPPPPAAPDTMGTAGPSPAEKAPAPGRSVAVVDLAWAGACRAPGHPLTLCGKTPFSSSLHFCRVGSFGWPPSRGATRRDLAEGISGGPTERRYERRPGPGGGARKPLAVPQINEVVALTTTSPALGATTP